MIALGASHHAFMPLQKLVVLTGEVMIAPGGFAVKTSVAGALTPPHPKGRGWVSWVTAAHRQTTSSQSKGVPLRFVEAHSDFNSFNPQVPSVLRPPGAGRWPQPPLPLCESPAPGMMNSHLCLHYAPCLLTLRHLTTFKTSLVYLYQLVL